MGIESIKKLKLSSNNIVPVKIISINNIITLSVQFEGQEFLVKAKNANQYAPGLKVYIQFQKIKDGFRPVFLDSINKPKIKKTRLPISNQNVKDGFKYCLDPPAKLETFGHTFKAQAQKIENVSSNVIQDSTLNFKKINLELIKPYLPSKKPFGKLIGELKREILESSVLKNIPIKPELIERLNETLQILTPRADTRPNESYLRRQIDISGVRYEAKLKQLLFQPEIPENRMELAKDLKGQLLELNQISEKVIRKLSEQNLIRQLTEFQQKIKISIDNIELNQISARISNQESQPLVLQIPNPICPNEKTINLFIRKDSQENKSGENGDKGFYNLAFYLELSDLGNIKMNAKVGTNSMAVRMDVEREDVAEFVRNNTTEFKEKMENNDLNTTVEVFKEEKIHPIKDNLIELLVSKNTSLLSVKT